MKLTLIGILSTIVIGEELNIVLENDPSFPRLPFIDVRFVQLDRNSRESARMLFHTNQFYMVHPRLFGEEDTVAVGFNSGGRPVMNSLESPFVVRDNFVGFRSPRRGEPLYYGAKKSAGFASEVGSFILTNSATDEMKLIVRPNNPQEFCSEDSGPIVYIPTAPHYRSDWVVLGEVRPVNDLTGVGISEAIGDDQIVLPYHVSSGDVVDKVPYETYERIGEMINATGAIAVDLRDSGFAITNCTDKLDAFPSLKYTLYTRSDDGPSKVVDIVLTAREYMTVEGDVCIVHIHPSSESRSGTLGMNIMRSITMHFDEHNNRIGLCDIRDT